MLVLDVIADDYENLDMVTAEVEKSSSRCGLSVRPDEVRLALVTLIETGLAKAFRLYATMQPPDEIEGVPPPGDMDNCYFWITPEGMKIQLSDYDSWPFDELGRLRKGWTPPAQDTEDTEEPGDRKTR